VWARTGNYRTDLHIYRQGILSTPPDVVRWSSAEGVLATCLSRSAIPSSIPITGLLASKRSRLAPSRARIETYLVLKVDKGDLTVRVPADNAELVGVRDVVGAEGLERVFEVLRAPHTEEPTNWSRRYKANLEKLASGDVNKVAEVVRDLWRRDKERGLSAGEKRMLAKARQILVSELALAEKTNEDKAEALLDEVLANLLRSRASGLGGRSAEPAPGAPGRLGCRRAPAHQFPGAVSGWPVLAG
jgi:CarD family transcriptional regulator